METEIKTDWTIVKELGRYLLCRCKCGIEKRILRYDFIHGKTRRCRSCAVTISNTSHGKSGTPEYEIWAAMIKRCTNKKNKDYKYYGGRGIRVCQRWMDSFENFISDMKPRTSRHHSIDRKKNSEGYTPENCQWATKEEQARNMSSNRIISFDGRSQCLEAWSEELKIDRMTLTSRLEKMSVEEAFSFHGNFHDRIITYNGVSQRLGDWSKELGIHRMTLHSRLKRGLPIDQVFSKKIGRWANVVK